MIASLTEVKCFSGNYVNLYITMGKGLCVCYIDGSDVKMLVINIISRGTDLSVIHSN